MHAPAPPPEARRDRAQPRPARRRCAARLLDAALRMAAAVRYDSLGTFEFLVDAADVRDDAPFAFIEANPRLQVEHTVTEEVTGVDLVQLQLRLAGGGIARRPRPAGAPQRRAASRSRCASTWRRSAPTAACGRRAATLTAFEPPSGPGRARRHVRLRRLHARIPRFDSLLAKVIGARHVRAASPPRVAQGRARARTSFASTASPTNVAFLRRLLRASGRRGATASTPASSRTTLRRAGGRRRRDAARRRRRAVLAGARVDAADPLAVLAHGKSGAPADARRTRSRSRPTAPSPSARRCRARSSASTSREGDAGARRPARCWSWKR